MSPATRRKRRTGFELGPGHHRGGPGLPRGVGHASELVASGTIFMASRAHKTIYDGCQVARSRGAAVKRFRFETPGAETALETRVLRAAAATARP